MLCVCVLIEGVVFTYPFPLTTSSFASCRRSVEVPGGGQIDCSIIAIHHMPQQHTMLSDVVDVLRQCPAVSLESQNGSAGGASKRQSRGQAWLDHVLRCCSSTTLPSLIEPSRQTDAWMN
jgi:hypothetical protein